MLYRVNAGPVQHIPILYRMIVTGRHQNHLHITLYPGRNLMLNRLFKTNTRLGTLSRRLYHEKVIEHYERPRNVGTLDKSSPNVGTGLVGAPACGDVMRLQIKVNPSTGVIEEARFKTFGCGSAIASSSLATEWIKGKTIKEAVEVKNTDIAKELCLPPVKLHCSMLAEDAIKSAVKDYQNKTVK